VYSTAPEGGVTAPRKRDYVYLGIALAVTIVAGFFGAYYFFADVAHGHCECPAGFGFTGGMSRVAPSSLGCAPPTAEVCYSNGLVVSYGGSVLSDLSFAFTQETNADAQAPAIPLGPNATVTMVNSTNAVVGVWNWSHSLWVSGSDWSIPPGQPVSFVLDTGLVFNSTLAGGVLWVTLSGDHGGIDEARLSY
jgi:hypothetical protein